MVFKNENSIEAKRKEGIFGIEKWTEGITITHNQGNIEVKSNSLGGELCDLGRNSKRVKLFIYAFKETEKEFDKEALQELEKETEKKNNWDDYVVPENLPEPVKPKKQNFSILIIAGIFIAAALGFIVAEASVHFIYFIGVYEVVLGLLIAYSLKYFIKLSNFTEIKKIEYLLYGIIFMTYFLNQYFQYEIIVYENNFERIGFYEFLKIRFSEGLQFKTLNTGWIGLVLSWILQLVITYYVAFLRILSIVITYQFERVPTEVLDFTYYHFIKEKSEAEVRTELTKKGWTDSENQKEVFEAIGALQGSSELRRLK